MALRMILPDLAPDDPVLPQGAVNLRVRDGYILLRVQDRTATFFYDECADTIWVFLVEELGKDGIPLDWVPRYMQWAQLRLPNMQIA